MDTREEPRLLRACDSLLMFVKVEPELLMDSSDKSCVGQRVQQKIARIERTLFDALELDA